MRLGLLVLVAAAGSASGLIRHCILGRWKDNVTEATQQEAIDALRALPDSVPEIITYTVGPDLNLTAGNYDFGLVGEFANASDFYAYEESEAHQVLSSVLFVRLSSVY